MASLDPPAVKEAASGAGGLCGGTYLNRGFAAYLDKKFANVPAWNANASYRSNAMRVFEKDIKMTFTYDEAQVWRIPVMGLDDNLVLGIRNGHLTVPWKDVQKVFEPVVREIVKLVKAQITATTNLGDHRVKMILLAGGFGRNKYLRSRLQDEVGGVIKVRNIENG